MRFIRPEILAPALAMLLSSASATSAAAAADKAPPTLAAALEGARHQLTVGPAGVGGDGAPVLRQAVADARYVGIGEDHGTREIPAFASTLCDMMAPQGLSALVLEIGPTAAATVGGIVAGPGRETKMAAFNRRYPNAVAFLDTRDDNAMAAHCLGVSSHPRLIGIDQEYIGAAGLILDRILETPLSPPARTAVLALRASERQAAARARETGDAAKLLMLSTTADQFAAAEAALRTGGNARARDLFAELRQSWDIYGRNARGETTANVTRALLMKRHLVRFLPASGKVLLKFGDWHLYKGINPLQERDIGNFIAERAEGEGTKSLHILVLGAKGTHLFPGGYERPLRLEPFEMAADRDYHWFQTVVDLQLAGGWTMFDLRSLRHRRIDGLDVDWRRVVEGYDLMIVVPQLTPSGAIAG